MNNRIKTIMTGAAPLLFFAGTMPTPAGAADQARANAPSQATQPATQPATHPATQPIPFPAAPQFQETEGIRR